jgi:hypothetical protein
MSIGFLFSSSFCLLAASTAFSCKNYFVKFMSTGFISSALLVEGLSASTEVPTAAVPFQITASKKRRGNPTPINVCRYLLRTCCQALAASALITDQFKRVVGGTAGSKLETEGDSANTHDPCSPPCTPATKSTPALYEYNFLNISADAGAAPCVAQLC